MANISGRNDHSFPWLGVIIASIAVLGMSLFAYSSIHEVGTGEVTPIKIIPEQSDAERHELKVICLNGVQYWKDDDRDMRSESLAPKYSPGSPHPDICEGHGVKRP